MTHNGPQPRRGGDSTVSRDAEWPAPLSPADQAVIDRVYDEFWRHLVEVDGVPDIGLMKRELHDYAVTLREVPKVYAEVTGGVLSKPNYPADTVIGVHDERCPHVAATKALHDALNHLLNAVSAKAAPDLLAEAVAHAERAILDY